MKRAKLTSLIIPLAIIFVTIATILWLSLRTFNICWKGKRILHPRHLRHKYLIILYFEVKNKDIILREVMIRWDKVKHAYSSTCIISVIFADSNNTILGLNFTDYTKDTYNFNVSLSIPLNLAVLVIDLNQNTLVDKYTVVVDKTFIEKQIKTEKIVAILAILLIFIWVLSCLVLSCSP